MEKKEIDSSRNPRHNYFTPEKFNAWNKLAKSFDSVKEIDFTVSIADVKKLTADRKNRKFVLEPLYKENPKTAEEVNSVKKQLFENSLRQPPLQQRNRNHPNSDLHRQKLSIPKNAKL